MLKLTIVLLVFGGLFSGAAFSENTPSIVKVYKNATCGCCDKWIKHLQQNGFTVEAIEIDDLDAFKSAAKVPPYLSSCHTAIVDGYVIEGHVPAEDIKKLLLNRPNVIGIAVPRMPIGSPGMEGPNPQPYKVLSFDSDKKIEEYCAH